jgi:hypothetical protein
VSDNQLIVAVSSVAIVLSVTLNTITTLKAAMRRRFGDSVSYWEFFALMVAYANCALAIYAMVMSAEYRLTVVALIMALVLNFGRRINES